MRFTTTLLLFTGLALAQEQKPLNERLNAWFDKAKSYIPQAATEPVKTAASGTAAKNVVRLTKDNWASVLTPSPVATQASGPEPWMVLVSGGNKTCFGQCERTETAWNKSATVFAVTPRSPNLAYINCDEQPVLCHTWFAGPIAIWYIELPIPSPDQSKPATTIHVVPLNGTTVTAEEIVAIYKDKTFEQRPVLDSMFHPFDGQLTQLGLNVPAAYILWAFGIVPSWTIMLGMSFLTRTLMSRRIAAQPEQRR